MLMQEDGEGKLSTRADYVLVHVHVQYNTYTCSENVFGDVGREDSSSGGRIEIME